MRLPLRGGFSSAMHAQLLLRLQSSHLSLLGIAGIFLG